MTMRGGRVKEHVVLHIPVREADALSQVLSDALEMDDFNLNEFEEEILQEVCEILDPEARSVP